MPGKFATKKRPYERQPIVPLGGLCADVSEASRKANQFSQLTNCRHNRLGEIEVRSGYRRWGLPHRGRVVATTEYRHDNEFRDIVCTWDVDTHMVSVIAFDSVNALPVTFDVVTAGLPEPKVAAMQFETYLLVAVHGVGVYSCSPTDETVTAWQTPILLGKQISPCPSQINYTNKVEGDLIVFDNERTGPGNSTMEYKYPFGEKEPAKIRLEIDVPYTLATDEDILKAKMFELWTPHASDGANAFPAKNYTDSWLSVEDMLKFRAPWTSTHLPHRGWVYRFVLERKLFDIRDIELIVSEAPSADVYVKDMMYIAPNLTQKRNVAGMHTFIDKLEGGARGWYFTYETVPSFPVYSLPKYTTDIASDTEFVKLSNRYRDYFNAQIDDDNPSHDDPFFFTARWLGWHDSQDADYHRKTPYKVAVPASELKNAPLITWDWDDFPGLPADAFRIVVYRTAYNFPDPDRNPIDSPDFDWYRFGRVGSIERDGEFFDNVPLPDFGNTPSDRDGYLAGQFSGSTLHLHDDLIALGDITSELAITAPAATAYCHAFQDDIHPFAIEKSELTILAADGKQKVHFGIQYVADNGAWSGITELVTDLSDINSAAVFVRVAIVLPKGYSGSITKVRIWRIEWNGTAWDYTPLKTANDTMEDIGSDAFVIAAGSQAEVDPDFTIDEMRVAHNVRSVDSGASIYSKENQMYIWPQENFLSVSKDDTITAMGFVLGQTYIFCDGSVWMTNFAELFENVSKDVGCISRWGWVNVHNVIFFLSQDGLQLVEGSGCRPYPTPDPDGPGGVVTEILKYLREHIDETLPLANARRASMGWLGNRQEIWLYFPDSHDLGPDPVSPAEDEASVLMPSPESSLIGVTGYNPSENPGLVPVFSIPNFRHGWMREKIFVYKVLSTRQAINYEFQLKPNAPYGRMLFNRHMDGKLFCAYADQAESTMPGFPGEIVYLHDNDFITEWSGRSYAELPMAMGRAEILKWLRRFKWTAEAHCNMFVVEGMMRTDGYKTEIYGTVSPEATLRPITILGSGALQTFAINAGQTLYNNQGRIPVFRIITEPSASGRHYMRLTSIEVQYHPSPGV